VWWECLEIFEKVSCLILIIVEYCLKSLLILPKVMLQQIIGEMVQFR